MRRVLALLLLFLLLPTFSVLASLLKYAPGRVIVKYKKGEIRLPRGLRIQSAASLDVRSASVRALHKKHRVAKVEQLFAEALKNRPDWTNLADYYVVYYSEDEAPTEVVRSFAADSQVDEASLDYIFKVMASSPPNDTYYLNDTQYGLTNSKIPQAWARTTGSTEVVVAVVDTGVNVNHVDLADRLDTLNAKSFVGESTTSDVADNFGHGTLVAGIIGAKTNNGQGMAGVDWNCKILPIKSLDDFGEGSMTDLLQGIKYAHSLGVEVINMSFGLENADAPYTETNYNGNVPGLNTLKEVCQAAFNDGIVLVAAAGNSGRDYFTYPAYYSPVLAVAATNQNDVKPSWSNYGPWVDVSAPGEAILSTSNDTNDGYIAESGTSFSSPHVAGVAALLKAARGSLTPQQIYTILQDSADNIDAQNPTFVGKLGAGRINAHRALAGALTRIDSPVSGAYVKGAVPISGEVAGWDFDRYTIEALSLSSSQVTTLETGTTSKEGRLYTWQTGTLEGEYRLRLIVRSTGGYSWEASVEVFVDNSTPEAEVTSPTASSTISGRVVILGTASDLYFNRYTLSYGQGVAPATWETIAYSSASDYYYSPVSAGILGTWETTGLSGSYTLKLFVEDRAGHTKTKTVQATLLNTQEPTREAEVISGSLGKTFSLPNPLVKTAAPGATTTFNYELSGNFATTIYLFDLGGNLIWQNSYASGENGGKSGVNNPPWSGINLYNQNVDNGVYVYQVVSDRRVIARGKVIVIN